MHWPHCLRQDFVFVSFSFNILSGKKSKVDTILIEKSDILSVISAKVAKICLKHFDNKPKHIQMQNLLECEKNLDTILISRNIGSQKFSRFGANFAKFCHF